MKSKTYEKLKLVIIDYIMTSDETIEDKLKVVQDFIILVDSYEKRNKGYQLRKEKK
jgi:hypothetical protein